MVIEDVTGQPWHRFLMDPDLCFNPEEYARFQTIVDGLQSGIPIQYLLGKAFFAGLELEVGPGVLIPRPETEELVEWALEIIRSKEKPRFLDVCTGSGCIPLAIKFRWPDAEVIGLELSPQALAIAQKNSSNLKLDVQWVCQDVLQADRDLFSNLDLITCNPPYIPASEQSEMQETVTRHEPSEALFVPDEAPLLFYIAVSDLGMNWLRPGGSLLFEIHEAFGPQVAAEMTRAGFVEVEIRLDMQGKNRMVGGKRPN